MKIAMPIAGNQSCLHFGHCEFFAFFEIDENSKQIIGKEFLTPPPHEPGILPPWIKNHGANLVITGGMGSRAQSLFMSHGIKVITGVPAGNPEEIVQSYLNGTLQTGDNVCEH